MTPRRLFAVYGGPDVIVRYPNGDETQYISTMFECDVTGGTLCAGDTDEVKSVAYWTLDEARQLRLSPWIPRVLPRLFESHAVPWFVATTWTPPAERAQ
ncbi:MAG TPA: hypothetical protein VHV78_17145 [Gemmatimonadaceae bacterium]|nr:hypothetical protein [Gemmatimonadaceae bacterium]